MDIYETPASRLVCEFIGNVNLFDGLLVEDEQDHAVIACPDLEQPIYVGHGISSRAENKKVTYALRPEKLLMTCKSRKRSSIRLQLVQGEVMTSPIWAAIRCITSSCPRAKSFRLSSPTPSATASGRPGMTRCTSGGKTTAAWYCNHEGIETTQALGAAAGDRHPLLLAVPVLLLPFFIVLKISFAEADVAIRPTPIV
jgi:ABC-type Fe3+/spermidine/putrescine transport system ATPase subunit